MYDYDTKAFSKVLDDQTIEALTYFSPDIDLELNRLIDVGVAHAVASYQAVLDQQQVEEMKAFFVAYQTLPEEVKAPIRETLQAAVAVPLVDPIKEEPIEEPVGVAQQEPLEG